MDENTKVIAEIVSENAVRVGGVLFHRTRKSVAEETEAVEYSRPLGLMKRQRIVVHYMECAACGRTYEHVNGDYERCPHCGAILGEVEDAR